jgi:hypothetical protein
MLYTAHRVLKTPNLPDDAYHSFSPQHPTCIWIRQCVENYSYAAKVAMYLCEEYTFRYNRIHTCEKHIIWLNNNKNCNFKIVSYKPETVLSYSQKFQELGHTPVPLAMFDDVKYHDTFKSYRFYYIVHKNRFARWTARPIPWWYTSGKYKLIK